jgi:hypothetical protein
MLLCSSFLCGNKEYINNPSKLPGRISSTACFDALELVNSSKLAKVNIEFIRA